MRHLAGSRLARAVPRFLPAALTGLAALCVGCTTLAEWVHNGFKVGPNFTEPPAAVAPEWIDGADSRIVHTPLDNDAWWNIFCDQELHDLIDTAYRQNLDLKTAATRVLEAQAQRNIAAGNLFPQSQTGVFEYAHAQLSKNLNIFGNPAAALPTNINLLATGFNASWELDFWGRLRRAIESSDADLDASVEAYHDALVTLLADVAVNYVQVRTFQQRIAYAQRNVEIQKGSLELAQAREAGGKASSLDVEQARSNLGETESLIPPLVIGLRQANDRLCVLLGMTTEDLVPHFQPARIPAAPADAVVGIPADLLQRRPDVRQRLREVAAQSAEVGVAEADLYPSIGVTGFIGYAADDIRLLFDTHSLTGLILPSVQWKILNYGRITNNVHLQDARLQRKVLQYQQTVLKAGREVEDALVAFLQYQLQARSLQESVTAAERSVDLVLAQYRDGRVDFNRVFTTQAQLVTQQDQLATAQGNIALSVIEIYRALGGGWKSFENCGSSEASPAPATEP
jgi:NodT family efflux transporter outer membrane factor (OMF) lipoprotein